MDEDYFLCRTDGLRWQFDDGRHTVYKILLGPELKYTDMDLVTGGNGFFGEYLVNALVQSGRSVRVIDPLKSETQHPRVQSIVGSILDRTQLDAAMKGVERIFHSAAMVPLARSTRDLRKVNVEGTRTLLQSARTHGVKKVVSLSSSAVYGIPASNPVDEISAKNPQDAYGASKLAAEEECLQFMREGLDVTIVRPRTILGPGRLGIFQILFEWLWQGSNLPVFGNGGNTYQFVHAADLARVCLLAADQRGSTSFNIGGAPYGTMRETLSGLIEHAGTDARIRSVPRLLGASAMQLASMVRLAPFSRYHFLMYGRSLYFDISKAETELRWRPLYGNIETLCETYDWYRANRDDILGGDSGSLHRKPVQQGILALGKYIL